MKRSFVTGGSGFVGGRIIEALVGRGDGVRALARSDAAERAVLARATAEQPLGGRAPAAERFGAPGPAEGEARPPGAVEVVRGDLDDVGAMTEGMRACDVVFHAAAYVAEHGALADFMRVTVAGTANVIAAAKAAGVARLVHVSTEAVLADGRAIVRADEMRPYPKRPAGPYAISKGAAERAVIAANGHGLETVVIRPRFVWGRGDTSLVPKIAAAARAGKFAWVDGGHYLTSTCHIENVVEGALRAAERGAPGEVYFLTDGEPIEFRELIETLLAAEGVDPGTRSIPHWLAAAAVTLTSWMREPPVTRTALALMAHEVTVDDMKARRDLGYTAHVSRAQGLAELRGTPFCSTTRAGTMAR